MSRRDSSAATSHRVSQFPEPVGHWAWDETEGCYAVRVAERDRPYPCGADCCGYERFAVVAVYRRYYSGRMKDTTMKQRPKPHPICSVDATPLCEGRPTASRPRWWYCPECFRDTDSILHLEHRTTPVD